MRREERREERIKERTKKTGKGETLQQLLPSYSRSFYQSIYSSIYHVHTGKMRAGSIGSRASDWDAWYKLKLVFPLNVLSASTILGKRQIYKTDR